MKKIRVELSELVQNNIISEATAEDIKAFYIKKSSDDVGRLFLIFGIFGALLIGLGIILILAHNWDALPRLYKTLVAFIPLGAGQIITFYALFKKRDSTSWLESSATFLFLAVGASIALVSQIYHIPGDLSAFILTWMLLCFPLMYISKSAMVSLLYIIGITYFACATGYWHYPASPYLYWGLLLLALPFYFWLWKNKRNTNFLMLHHWFIPLSVLIAMGTLSGKDEEFMVLPYMSVLGLLYLSGESRFIKYQATFTNSFRFIGVSGTIFLLLFLSFDRFWKELFRAEISYEVLFSDVLIMTFIVVSLNIVFWIKLIKQHYISILDPMGWTSLAFVIIFISGLYAPVLAIILINILTLYIGLFFVVDGLGKHKLSVVNFGILIMAALVLCRFFDLNLSFVFRGLLFVAVGGVFFLVNYRMLKRNKKAKI